MLLVLVPGLAYFAWFAPRVPSDHPVVFRFDQPLQGVRRITATWSDPTEAGTPIAGSTFEIPPASPPSELRTTVHIPDGEFWVDLELERAEGTDSIRRKIHLADGETTIIVAVPSSSRE